MCKKEKHKKKHNPNWPKTPDHLYRILTVGASGSGKTNALFNLNKLTLTGEH